MRARLGRWIDALRTGFWFVPLVMMLLACGLAIGLLSLDQRFDPGLQSTLAWAYSGGPSGARSVLSTIAGSMITAASVTFSLASVALSIASQQYGSRVLRNFMRDRITQVLLGTFVSTFVYSVLVVRAIRGSEQANGFVPAISVTMAIVFAVVSLTLLIFFVHHVSESIQAAHIVKVIAADMRDAIPRLYPTEAGRGQEEGKAGDFRQGERTEIGVERGGYLQNVDLDTLLEVAQKHDVFFEVTLKPGDYLVDGGLIVVVWGRWGAEATVEETVRKAFYFGQQRTPMQDVRYQFQQLSDVVIRALSAGINDPFTAINGIDAMASGLTALAKRSQVKHVRESADGTARLLVPTAEMAEVLEETVGHIGVYAAEDPFVVRALRSALRSVEPHLQTAEARRVLREVSADLDAREIAKRKEAGVMALREAVDER